MSENRYILVVGSSSDMAKSTIKEFAKNGYNFYLASRDLDDSVLSAKNIEIRYGVKAKAKYLDILDMDSHDEFYNSLDIKPFGVITFVGYLGSQDIAQKSNEESLRVLNTNFVGVVNLLNIIANDLESKKAGFIIGVSSVAGDRGRASNYLYGSAKAGFTAYLSGLRNRLSSSNISVTTVKPGFVDTSMTSGMNLPKPLLATTNEVAKDIYKAYLKRSDIVYTKWFWRLIMLIIVHIPEKIFKKLKL